MRLVAIVGCSGDGKSALARALAAKTGLPLVHIGQEYWQPGWVEPPFEQWRGRHAELIAAPEWIIDGSSPDTLPARAAAADTIVFLDLPRRLCLLRVLRRAVWGFGRPRPDMAPGCPERIDPAFVHYVWFFARDTRPRIMAALKGCDVVHFGSSGAARRWLGQVSKGADHDRTL